MKNKRALSDKFFEKFMPGGYLTAITDIVRRTDELMMCMRGKSVDIYYKSMVAINKYDHEHPETAGVIDMRIAMSSFVGYGLYNEYMLNVKYETDDKGKLTCKFVSDVAQIQLVDPQSN